MSIIHTNALALPSPRLSSLLAMGCLLLAVLLPLLSLYILLIKPAIFLAGLGLGGTAFPPASMALQLWQRVAIVAVGAIPVAFVVFALLRVRRCFVSFARAEYFTVDVVQGLAGFAAGVFTSTIVAMLSTPVMSLLLSLHAHARQGTVTVNVSSDELLTLVFAGVAWQIAGVMTKAAVLADEHSKFI